MNILEIITTLTPSEIKYRDSSSSQNNFYNNLPTYKKSNNLGNIVKFSLNDMIKTTEFKVLLRDKYDYPTIFFKKHSRYSIVPLHVGDYIEINYVLKGEVQAYIEDENYLLKENDLCLIASNTIHTLGETTEDDIIINILISPKYFSPSILSQLSEGNSIYNFILHCLSPSEKKPAYLLIRESSDLKEILLGIFEEQYRHQLEYVKIMNAFLLILLLRIIRSENYELHDNYNLEESISNYIKSNFRDISLKKAADFFSFHPNYFSSLVHKLTGKNFKSLILEERLKMAAYYLKETDWPINKIIDELGISNTSFFYKKFFEFYGQTPKNYRDNIKNK